MRIWDIPCSCPSCAWKGPLSELEPLEDDDGNLGCPQCLTIATQHHPNLPTVKAEVLPYTEFRKDGWPLCPVCGEDELQNSWVGLTTPDVKPTLEDYLKAGLSCLMCGWRSDGVDDIGVRGAFTFEPAYTWTDGGDESITMEKILEARRQIEAKIPTPKPVSFDVTEEDILNLLSLERVIQIQGFPMSALEIVPDPELPPFRVYYDGRRTIRIGTVVAQALHEERQP